MEGGGGQPAVAVHAEPEEGSPRVFRRRRAGPFVYSLTAGQTCFLRRNRGTGFTEVMNTYFFWLFGCLVVWLFGCLVVWLFGCLVVLVVWLLFGCLVVWLFGCLVVWLFGCLFVWLVVFELVVCGGSQTDELRRRGRGGRTDSRPPSSPRRPSPKRMHVRDRASPRWLSTSAPMTRTFLYSPPRMKCTPLTIPTTKPLHAAVTSNANAPSAPIAACTCKQG